METLGIMIALVVSLLALAVSYGALRQTVIGHSAAILILQQEAEKRLAILQGIDTNQQLLTQRLEIMEKG